MPFSGESLWSSLPDHLRLLWLIIATVLLEQLWTRFPYEIDRLEEVAVELTEANYSHRRLSGTPFFLSFKRLDVGGRNMFSVVHMQKHWRLRAPSPRNLAWRQCFNYSHFGKAGFSYEDQKDQVKIAGLVVWSACWLDKGRFEGSTSAP